MKLALTYSAWLEMRQIPVSTAREISVAILDLKRDPHPPERDAVPGQRGCFRIPVEGFWVLYHLGAGEGPITVLGVLDEHSPTLH